MGPERGSSEVRLVDRVLFLGLGPEAGFPVSWTVGCLSGLGDGRSTDGKLGTWGRGGMRGDPVVERCANSLAIVLLDWASSAFTDGFSERSKAVVAPVASEPPFPVAEVLPLVRLNSGSGWSCTIMSFGRVLRSCADTPDPPVTKMTASMVKTHTLTGQRPV